MAFFNSVNSSATRQVCFMAALALVTLPICDGAALAKGKTASTKTRRAHSYFVPPPPAYAPAIVPEIQYQTNNQTTAEDGSEKLVETDSADKYVKAKQGYQDPKAVRTNKYVTYWNQK